jgi:hypothetical protein
MSITPEQALAVGKILHPDWGPWHIESDGARYALVHGSRLYDPTTPAECWAMVGWVLAKQYQVHYELSSDESGTIKYWANAVGLIDQYQYETQEERSGSTRREALVNLVLAIGDKK